MPISSIVAAALAILAGLFAALAVFRQSKTGRWMRLYNAARQALQHQLYPEAERLLRHALSLSRSPARRAATQIALAEVVYRLGRLEEADRLLEDAVPTLQEAFPDGHFELGRAYSLRGELELDRGRYADAQRSYQHALAEDERIGNEARRLFTFQRLIEALLRQGNRGRALDIVEDCLALEREFMSKVTQRDGRQYILMTLPDLRFCREEWDDARQLYREKVAHFERLLAPGIDVGHYQWRLAATLEALGDLPEAAAVYRRAADTYRRQFAAGHPRVALSLARLAGALERAGEAQQSGNVREEAREMLERAGLPDHPELAPASALQ